MVFVKALDMSSALRSDDVPGRLHDLLQAYVFERDLLEKCHNLRLDRVATPLGHGQVTPPGSSMKVHFLVFELADGDIRQFMSFSRQFDLAWILRSLHHTAVGLNQLHRSGISHQDLKPSNVLVFQEQTSKIGDLGRSVYRERSAPHEELLVAGDRSYAPPELLYGYVDPDWHTRRLGCDCYLLGSHMLFLFAGVSMTSAILSAMSPEHHWRTWALSYDQVLPFLREAFNSVMNDFEQGIKPLGEGPLKELPRELCEMIRQLCEPDINLRCAEKKLSAYPRFDLQRHVSKLDRMAKMAEFFVGKRV